MKKYIKIKDEDYDIEEEYYQQVNNKLYLTVIYKIPTLDYDGNSSDNWYDTKEVRYLTGVVDK